LAATLFLAANSVQISSELGGYLLTPKLQRNSEIHIHVIKQSCFCIKVWAISMLFAKFSVENVPKT
jgi:hypothetical protein